MNPLLKNIIEALVFISLEPLTPEKIKAVVEEFPEQEIQEALDLLREEYSSEARGIHITQSAGGLLFITRPECDPWIKRLLQIEKKSKLTKASLETLSIIAYHQPITLSEISAIRGVDSAYTLKNLLQKKMVKIVGRKKAPGKPLIYRTTDNFLTYFGLNSLDDLPSEEELSKIIEDEEEKTIED